ncbi:hypothetical protein ASG57_29775 [Bradyrhizobium sp. Leaf396]|jgi:hypothetical protein|nr:hypothetical protein ASG57_29775 [Bradyrhizobium sp. Leaf396]
MAADLQQEQSLKPGAADFASASPASLQYAKGARQRSSCQALDMPMRMKPARHLARIPGLLQARSLRCKPAQRMRFLQ